MNKLLAISLAPNGNGFTGIGTSPLANPGGNSVSIFSNFLSTIVGVMTIVAVIWAVFTIITGAIAIIGSGGDKQALESARGTITSALIGVFILFAVFAIIQLINTFFGLHILNLTIPTLKQ
jgi:magnesium-transporting ATPase (P-type)